MATTCEVPMSLAGVQIATSAFEIVYSHLLKHSVHHNMHMREARVRNKKRTLRHLHAMHASSAGLRAIHGAVSGPGIYVRYVLTRRQINVLAEEGAAKDLERLAQTFERRMLLRVDQERGGGVPFTNYLPGEYYLRRCPGGIAATHPKCERAVAAGVLDARFVGHLAPWNLMLLCS